MCILNLIRQKILKALNGLRTSLPPKQMHAPQQPKLLNLFEAFFRNFSIMLGLNQYTFLESEALCAVCNRYCVKNHCSGGDCGWLWGHDNCHCHGCRRKQAVRDSSSDLRYVYVILVNVILLFLNKGLFDYFSINSKSSLNLLLT